MVNRDPNIYYLQETENKYKDILDLAKELLEFGKKNIELLKPYL